MCQRYKKVWEITNFSTIVTTPRNDYCPERRYIPKNFTLMIQKISIRMTQEHGFALDDNRTLTELNPKEMLLYSAADCAGRTIVGLLKEHTAQMTSLVITLEGTLSTPKLIAESRYTSFNIIYLAECETLKDQIIISRAINLAHDKYCGMLLMLRKIAPLAHETSIVTTGVEQEA